MRTGKYQIQEEIINIVDSKYMKDFLTDIQDDITIDGFIELITAAPVSLERKEKLLERLSELSASKDDFKYISACYRTAMMAMHRLYHMDNRKNYFKLHLYDMDGYKELFIDTAIFVYPWEKYSILKIWISFIIEEHIVIQI